MIAHTTLMGVALMLTGYIIYSFVQDAPHGKIFGALIGGTISLGGLMFALGGNL